MSLKRILIIRFSALGDVALLVPAVRSLVAAHQDVEVTVVTRPKFATLFYDIERVVTFPADVDYTYTGVLGIRDLFKTLIRKGDYDVVIDMHDHIRTIALRTLFRIFGTRVIVFEKGREEKKAFARKENKVVKPLLHTVERYQKAFEKAGFPFSIIDGPYFQLNESITSAVKDWLAVNKLEKKEKWIGLAPFSAHTSKTWPVDNYRKLVEQHLAREKSKFFLFGGGPKELKFFETLKQSFPDEAVVVAGQLKLRQEIALMQYLDVMLCVDSSNMHLASLAGVPVLSIWGGTHPDVGFAPFRKNMESIVQIPREELPCRPCSVYGRETCHVGGFPCLNKITSEEIASRLINKQYQ